MYVSWRNGNRNRNTRYIFPYFTKNLWLLNFNYTLDYILDKKITIDTRGVILQNLYISYTKGVKLLVDGVCTLFNYVNL